VPKKEQAYNEYTIERSKTINKKCADWKAKQIEEFKRKNEGVDVPGFTHWHNLWNNVGKP